MANPEQHQSPPGLQSKMIPIPDCGENSYRGTGRLAGKAAVITGGDSGIGRAVAIAYAREGADVLISYLSEDDDADDTARYVKDAGRQVVLVRGDISEPQHCREVVAEAVAAFGRIDILVSNAAYQMTYDSIEEIADEEWDRTWATNMSAFFHLTKAALPHMGRGSSIIGSSSVNSDSPSPTLAPYAATKAAIANFCASLAQLLGPRGIRVNSVAPGTILLPEEKRTPNVEKLIRSTPLEKAGTAQDIAETVLFLVTRSDFITGQVLAVDGGKSIP